MNRRWGRHLGVGTGHRCRGDGNGRSPNHGGTLPRLRLGYGRHEILHMLAHPMASQIHAALTDERPYDHARHVAALRALPASWESQRAQRKLQSAHRRRWRASKRRR